MDKRHGGLRDARGDWDDEDVTGGARQAVGEMDHGVAGGTVGSKYGVAAKHEHYTIYCDAGARA